MNASESTGLLGGVAGYLARAMMALQLALAAWLAIEGYITGGMVIAATLLLNKAVSPIHRLLGHWSDVVAARQAYEHLNLLLAEDQATGTQMKLPSPTGRLVVAEAVAVPPGTTKVAIAGLSFTVEAGRTVAIVGPSASGKSCLVKLLTGIWKPARGTVRLDGVELFDWNHEELGPHIGYVPQEIEFFEGTIAENIARLGPVDPDKVVEAAKLIGIHEAILQLPKGYDTVLGESGHALSAGQRQRVAIARALYGSPRYVVMDEPNSNLDEMGEQALSKAIAAVKERGCTVILTTQRPRPILAVDELLVLRDGAQVRYGPAKVMLEAVRRARSPGAEPESRPIQA
jgi:PrtD family type I secretion system ABC transporter